MADNLDLLKQKIDTDINENGAPGSILASNHNEILTQVLSKVGKYTGSPFIAKKNETLFGSGIFSWNNNAMNDTNSFEITVSKLTTDLNDIGTLLNQTVTGSIIRFKDYVGRSVFLEYQSHVASVDGSLNSIYNITVKGFINNPNYIYQDTETQIAIIDFLVVQVSSTDQLVNLGENGIYPFITLQDLPPLISPLPLSYSIIWTGVGLIFDLTASRYYIIDTYYSATPNQETLVVADPTFDRFDLPVADIYGLISVIQGVPSASPAKPNYDKNTQFPLGFIFVQANATTPVEIDNLLIYNENVGSVGGEWDKNANTIPIYNVNGWVAGDYDSIEQPYDGTKSLKLNIANADYGIWSDPVGVLVENITAISFWVKLPIDLSANQVTYISYLSPNDNITEFEVLTFQNIANLGIDKSLTTWQKATIIGSEIISFFNIHHASETTMKTFGLQIRVVGVNDFVYIDKIEIQTTGTTQPPTPTIANHSDLVLDDGRNPHGTTKEDLGIVSQVTITTAVSITSETLSDDGFDLDGKNVLIQNGVNAINFTVGATENQIFSIQKEGTGAITFLASSGKTIRQVDSTDVLDGAVGSTATISVVGLIVSIRISNA